MKDGALMGMHEFDGIFKGNDMDLLRLIYFIEHRGERRGLAAAGGAGDEYNPAFFLRHFSKDGRQSQAFQRRDFRLQFPHHDRLPSILLENVDSKSREICQRVTAIA